MNYELFYMKSDAHSVAVGHSGRLWKRRWGRLLIVVSILQLNLGCSELKDDDTRVEAANPPAELVAGILRSARDTASISATSQSDIKSSAFIHPDQVFEFWMYLAILTDKEGQTYAFQQRFARIKVASDALSTESEWHYSAVVAVDFQFHMVPTGPSLARQFVEREALALAGTDPVRQRVWSGAYSTQRLGPESCRFSAEVNVPQLQLRFNEPTVDGGVCGSTLTGSVDRVAGLSLSRSRALQVKGRWLEQESNNELDGYGWVVRGWGIPPDTAGAAVVFDRAWLVLKDQQQRPRGLQLQRSRRASGRGPEITTAITTSLGSLSDIKLDSTNLNAQLADSHDRSGNNLPKSWHLQLSDLALDVSLSPVTDPSVNVSLPGPFWFGVVAVNGSQSGFGFIEYSQP